MKELLYLHWRLERNHIKRRLSYLRIYFDWAGTITYLWLAAFFLFLIGWYLYDPFGRIPLPVRQNIVLAGQLLLLGVPGFWLLGGILRAAFTPVFLSRHPGSFRSPRFRGSSGYSLHGVFALTHPTGYGAGVNWSRVICCVVDGYCPGVVFPSFLGTYHAADGAGPYLAYLDAFQRQARLATLSPAKSARTPFIKASGVSLSSTRVGFELEERASLEEYSPDSMGCADHALTLDPPDAFGGSFHPGDEFI